MRVAMSWVFTLSITLYVLLHFIDFFFPTHILLQVLSVLGFLALFSAFMYSNIRSMLLPLFLAVSSIIIMLFTNYEGSFLSNIGEGFRQMRPLLGLVFIVPIVSWVLRYEPYIEDMMVFFRKQLHNSKRFYIGLTSVTQVISYFLLIGTIPVMYQILHTTLKGKNDEIWKSYQTKILIRSFALGTMWIISVPSFSYAIQSTGASLPIAIIQGFFMFLVGITLATVFLHFYEKRNQLNLTEGIQEEIARVLSDDSSSRHTKQKVIEFFILFITLLGSILSLHIIFSIDILIVIPLVIIGWTFFYFVFKRDLSRYLREGTYYFFRGIPLKSKEMSIILSAGLLIYSLNISGLGSFFVEGIYHFTENLAFINFLSVLPLIVIILGFVGLSPLTVMVLLGEIIQNINLPFPPDLILLSLTLGSCLAIMLSPLAIPVIILSNENGRSPLENSFKLNWLYAIVFYLLIECYLQIRLW